MVAFFVNITTYNIPTRKLKFSPIIKENIINEDSNSIQKLYCNMSNALIDLATAHVGKSI
jgi:hypothetical protein